METIIFQINLKKQYGGFAAVSNFIAKMEKGEELNMEEVRGVRNLLYRREQKLCMRDAIAFSVKNEEHLKEITRPENLIQGSRGYHKIYYVEISEDCIDDVVELQYYILMKKFFSETH